MDQILASHGAKVRFGLATFSSGSSETSCGAGNVLVDIGGNTGAAIQTAISGTGPVGRTPIVDTLQDPASGTLTFYGQVCLDLQDGSITDLAIVYGCPGPIVD